MRRKIDNSFQPIAIRQMNNQRIETWALFRFKDFCDRYGFERVGGEPVNRFRRQRDDLAFAKER